jgi:hypothetical protein
MYVKNNNYTINYLKPNVNSKVEVYNFWFEYGSNKAGQVVC